MLVAVGCVGRPPEKLLTPAPVAPTATAPTASAPATPLPKPGDAKVMVIVEENREYGEIIGKRTDAPYLNALADQFGLAASYDAGYPVSCPSLPAYLLMTQGTTSDICDNDPPPKHRLRGDNIFHQVASAGLQWRSYAESMSGNCQLTRSGSYAPKHVPAPYYTNEAANCARWSVPLGTESAGAFQADLAVGTLPAYAFVTPDLCNDMHGCDSKSQRSGAEEIKAGDDWLARWMPKIFDSPDFRAGRLVVLITWDEGSDSSNHVATLVISPTTRGIRSEAPYTHCSLLRTTEEILGLPPLGCAASARSMRAEFRLDR
ncbi:MAG: alkaline phosphatase family protein [Egibacteraceae bacterium]